jgi:hypothetical protein
LNANILYILQQQQQLTADLNSFIVLCHLSIVLNHKPDPFNFSSIHTPCEGTFKNGAIKRKVKKSEPTSCLPIIPILCLLA